MSATRGVIVEANLLAASGSVYPTQHNTTNARTRTHACAGKIRRLRTAQMAETAEESERQRETESVRAHTHKQDPHSAFQKRELEQSLKAEKDTVQHLARTSLRAGRLAVVLGQCASLAHLNPDVSDTPGVPP